MIEMLANKIKHSDRQGYADLLLLLLLLLLYTEKYGVGTILT